MSGVNKNYNLCFWCSKAIFFLMNALVYELQRFKVCFRIVQTDFDFHILFQGKDSNPNYDGISISVSSDLSENNGCKKPNIIELTLLKREVDKNNSMLFKFDKKIVL